MDRWGGETYRLRPCGTMGKHGAAGAGKWGEAGRAAREEADEAAAARSPEGFAQRISSLKQDSVHIRFSLSQKHCLAAVWRWDEGMQDRTVLQRCRPHRWGLGVGDQSYGSGSEVCRR